MKYYDYTIQFDAVARTNGIYVGYTGFIIYCYPSAKGITLAKKYIDKHSKFAKFENKLDKLLK